ncbi:ComEC/Rec2 family competence protein [Brachyspira pilosicoli]|uniref:ComEC family competence protein n=1 Tax=Brachyspira pilosicoli TaxID=52584 RepID=A0A5C8F496_BRAPL|nr:ComEC/Rec2 family competence protein [Brachyspira pilosicoli]TXJ43981.1 ComEC family competence protein [Brachyspira pilosicoli]
MIKSIYPITYILYITTSFALGVSIALKFSTNYFLSLIISFILIVVSIVLAVYNKNSFFILVISIFFLGYSYTISRYYNIFLSPLKEFKKEIKAYSCKIIDYDGVVNLRDRYVAYVDSVYDGENWYNYAGKIRLYHNSAKPIYINDTITVYAKIRLYKNILTNNIKIVKALENQMLYGVSSIYPYINFTVQKESFSILNFLNRIGIYFRNTIKKSLGEHIEPISYSVAQCIITGDKYIIPANINQYFINSGISHILSISGLHISMILFILFTVLSFLPINFYNKIFIATITTIIIYPTVSIFSVSIVRSSIMAFCILISYYFDKDRNNVNSLFLAALIILLIEPNSIREISFQFSFLATLGIILYYPIYNFFIITKIKKLKLNTFFKNMFIIISGFLLINIISLVSILPLSIYHFKILNLNSIIANIFAVPLSFIILSSSLITIFTHQIFYILSIYPAKTTEFAANILIELSKKVSSFQYLRYDFELNMYIAIFITFVIMIIGLLLNIKINKRI